jgi:hypothetical protein
MYGDSTNLSSFVTNLFSPAVSCKMFAAESRKKNSQKLLSVAATFFFKSVLYCGA